MKTFNIILFALFSLSAYNGSAQNYIQRPFSKDVQKVSNRQFLHHERVLMVLSVDASNQTLSKDVQFVSNKIERNGYEGNMKSEYPVWIIGKDVNKIGMPKKAREPQKEAIFNPDIIVRD